MSAGVYVTSTLLTFVSFVLYPILTSPLSSGVTVGFVGLIFTLTFTVLVFVCVAAKGPFAGPLAGNVTLTSRSTSSPPRPVTVSPDTHA